MAPVESLALRPRLLEGTGRLCVPLLQIRQSGVGLTGARGRLLEPGLLLSFRRVQALAAG